MKIWQAILLSMLLVAMPVLSACDWLGIGNSRQQQEQEYYRKQLEAIHQAQEADRKAQDQYNKNLQEGLQEYLKEYHEYQQKKQLKQLQQLEQLEGMPSANQTTGNLTGDD
jgi:regulator of protease activity HflC (stomatin/prohibitin superfamily)